MLALNFGQSVANALINMSSFSRSESSAYLADREHTEMREDTAYQRAVKDMQAAGLNPYTVGANPSPSSSSQVGSNTVMHKLEMLGYLLELGNLSVKNVNSINGILGNVIKALK